MSLKQKIKENIKNNQFNTVNCLFVDFDDVKEPMDNQLVLTIDN